MFADVDLRRLAELTAPERAFLSIYLASPDSVSRLEKRLAKLRRVLDGREEREHFDENVQAVLKYLSRNPLTTGSLALFSCWALDFFQAVPLTARVADLVWVDSSPYIRPLAELQEEYENVAVVVADNKRARIYLVSSAVAGDAEVVKGNVKNHVRVGGWSQKRYERRRDKQLLLYAREIAGAVARLDREEAFRRILLVGGKEILRIVHDNLPQALQARTDWKALDLRRGDAAIHEDVMELFLEQERRSETALWARIGAQYLRGGLAAVGLEDVLSAVRDGRVDTAIIERGFQAAGRRCRACERLDPGAVATCSACGSDSVFEVDMVNEIVEMLQLTGAAVDFCDPIDALADVGHIAALLRY
ncbi:hypothetical protein HQ560_19970 [bacterium]|nr:hypothetical protein [bacterium]